jgi:tetratricopeptide (TPR) repeat protein
MKKILLFGTLISVVFISCSKNKNIADRADYNAFLTDTYHEKEIAKNDYEINFWKNKLLLDTGSFVNMLELGFNYLHHFKLHGEVEDVKFADSLFLRSNTKLNYKTPEIYYSLSQNAITQHRFQDAYNYTEAAIKNGGAEYTTDLLKFDAGMELGLYYEASRKLNKINTPGNFDYMIRKAKLEDHKGNLDKAIELMEQAFEKVKNINKKSSYAWTLSNLADMYGHAGRVKEAYDSYINVLKRDSANLYCLKGIAYIAYAHDKNTAEAKRILNFILAKTKMPDLHLMLADIAEFEGDKKEKENQINLFLYEAKQTKYGAMYNKYLFTIYADELNAGANALSIAQKEADSRPTPEALSWLAWAYYKNGNIDKAFATAKNYVTNKCFEPHVLFRLGVIYNAAGKKDKAKEFLREVLKSSFEIGPVKEAEVKNTLTNL